MKSVYALIPAALLAGTVLSASVEAKRVEDPSVHAERSEREAKILQDHGSPAENEQALSQSSGAAKTRKLASDAKSRKLAERQEASDDAQDARSRERASCASRSP